MFAKTAEQLMRSRYTAHVVVACDYLKQSSHESLLGDFDEAEVKAWAKQNKWQKLEIVAHTNGQTTDEIGTVEFKAYYKGVDNILKLHHENSNFVKMNQQWQYHSGTVNPKAAKTQQRNEACACGSGKKYKKCCG
jgi:SEC-C motif-containing protein